MTVKQMTDLAGKRVLIRQDLNVPLMDGEITSDVRIRASLPTLQKAVAAGAQVIVMSHLGRPTEGEYDESLSAGAGCWRLSELLGQEVALVSWQENGVALENGQVALLENVRFNAGEKKDDEALSKAYAALCDIYVMDAFGTAHRASASTHGAGKFAPVACAGPLLAGELAALEKSLAKPARPLVALVGAPGFYQADRTGCSV